MPSHLHALAGAWGAGAAYWRMVELREAEKHAVRLAGFLGALLEALPSLPPSALSPRRFWIPNASRSLPP